MLLLLKQQITGWELQMNLKKNGIFQIVLVPLMHVMMECTKNGGSAFYNYKGFHSIVLLAVCDAKYCFTLLDIGGVGSTNNVNILSKSDIGRLFDESLSSFSVPSHSSHGCKTLPYVIVGDDIFPLKPFPGRNLEECHHVFNYRLS